MNGRCDIDPLDVVEDVCDLCGGEFCGACLLWPRGRKKAPVCRDCAIRASGIRGSTKIDRRTGRRELRKRREELHQTKDQRSAGGFKFFDEEENFVLLTEEFTGEVATNDAGPSRRRLSLGRRRHIDEPPAEQAAHPDSDTAADAEASSQPATYDEDPFTDTDESTDLAGELASADSELPGEPPADIPLIERTLMQSDHGSATAMLEHLRSNSEAEHRGAAVPPATRFNFESDPFAHLSIDQDPFGDAPTPILERDPFTVISAPGPVPQPAPPVIELPGSTELPDRPRLRSPGPSGADVDTNGNWIPPVLRGMAPKQEREHDLLPRRREVIGENQVPPGL